MSDRPSVFISAGEASGDRYAGRLAGELRRRVSGVRLTGLGGSRMAEAGVERLAGLDELAVMGVVEVLGSLPTILRLRQRVRRRLVREPVDLLVAVNYPGFNLPLCRFAARRGMPVLYYAPPQVWAWRPGRARAVAEHSDLVCTVLPFAAEPFERAGADVEFVGHPLLDEAGGERADGRHRGDEKPVLGLFPGSRRQEVGALLPPMVEAARRLRRVRPELRVRVARASDVPVADYRTPGEPLELAAAGSLARRATAALAASGTVTLELALHDTPMAVAYRTHPVTWEIARRMVRVEHVSLVNLVHGSRLVPELLQGEATGGAMADAVAPMLEPGRRRREVRRGLEAVRSRLGRTGVAGRVADRCVSLLKRRRSAA